MDVIEAIKARRSIRKYQDREVSIDLIKEVIDAARLAPSSDNKQPSRYVIVNDQKTKEKLRENKIFYQDFVYKAPAIIVCCANPGVYSIYEKRDETKAVRDLSIASSFLVLRATELGLGTCYVGWMEKEKVKDVLGIPKDYIVPFAITVGYAGERVKAHARKGLDEIVLKNKIYTC